MNVMQVPTNYDLMFKMPKVFRGNTLDMARY